MSDKAMHIWTVYYQPKDYPQGFIARLFLVTDMGAYATDQTVTGSTLAEVREKLPKGLCCMERQAHDDPVIVESWL